MGETESEDESNYNSNSNKKRNRKQSDDCDDDGLDGMPLIKKHKIQNIEMQNNDPTTFAINSVHDVLAFFYQIGYAQYVEMLTPRFEEDCVDGKTLPLLTEEHLKSYGIHKLYDRIMIIKAIKKLQP